MAITKKPTPVAARQVAKAPVVEKTKTVAAKPVAKQPVKAAQAEEKYYKDQYGSVHGPEVETFIGTAIYAYTDKPNKFDGKESYGLHIILPKEPNERYSQEFLDKQEKVVDNITAVATKVVAQHAKAKMFDPMNFLKDGDDKLTQAGEQRKEFANHWFVVCNSNNPIPCVDRYAKTIDPSEILAGMKVRVRGKVVASTPGGNCKVSIKPFVIQLVEDDGTRLTGRNTVANLTPLDDLPPESMIEDEGVTEEVTEDSEYTEDSLDNV